jgi:hypothetical protein
MFDKPLNHAGITGIELSVSSVNIGVVSCRRRSNAFDLAVIFRLGLCEGAKPIRLTLAMLGRRLLEPAAGLCHSSVVSAGASEHPADGARSIRRKRIPVCAGSALAKGPASRCRCAE